MATKAATKAGAKAASLAAAMMLMAVMSLMLAACGGSGAGGSGAAGSTQGGAAGSDGGSGVADGTGAGTGQTGAGAGASGAPIRLVNGKIEIDAQLKAYAKDYQERTGQEVIIESLGGGVNILAQIKNYHAAGNTPDIFVTNVNEREQLADLYLDLSDQPWVAETDAYLTDTDGKVIGAPFSVEGIGLVYNADILAKAGIDPNTLINIGAQRAAFEKLDAMKGELGLSAVVSAAAESGQMYWATGNHLMSAYLSMGMARDDKTLVDMMNRGEIDEARMGQFADYVKLLFEYADPAVLLSGTYDDQLALFAQGKTAFLCQGNWVDPSLETYGVTFGCGILPYAFLETDTPGATADSPTWWAVYRGGANIDAAKAFLT
ncbi:MAG: extracellular solute-binding protein, partial [Lachnospiraceae bacterium]|nr:extracellular solute-binding protein [Lachnospiraceae bacterium]